MDLQLFVLVYDQKVKEVANTREDVHDHEPRCVIPLSGQLNEESLRTGSFNQACRHLL